LKRLNDFPEELFLLQENFRDAKIAVGKNKSIARKKVSTHAKNARVVPE
jgi:hypothetical protein